MRRGVTGVVAVLLLAACGGPSSAASGTQPSPVETSAADEQPSATTDPAASPADAVTVGDDITMLTPKCAVATQQNIDALDVLLDRADSGDTPADPEVQDAATTSGDAVSTACGPSQYGRALSLLIAHINTEGAARTAPAQALIEQMVTTFCPTVKTYGYTTDSKEICAALGLA